MLEISCTGSASVQLRATIGVPAKRNLMEFRWWADSGTLLDAYWTANIQYRVSMDPQAKRADGGPLLNVVCIVVLFCAMCTRKERDTVSIQTQINSFQCQTLRCMSYFLKEKNAMMLVDRISSHRDISNEYAPCVYVQN